jgi:hypothetical protein
MKKTISNIILLISILVSIICCEPNLELSIRQPDDRIVIDGWIESGEFASVLLTSNAPFFSTLDSASIRDLVLSRAKVSIVNKGDTSILNLKKNENYFPPVIYQTLNFKGISGEKYTIIAEYGGKTAVAETGIPEPVPIDTLYYGPSDLEDSLRIVYLEFTDPPGKNYYRIFVRRVNKEKRFKSTFIMALNDIYFSERKAYISLAGISESMLSNQGENFFVAGDTIQLKLCTMDKISFDFWSSFQDEQINVNNPFASSIAEVKSNVKGGLGVWSGYGVSKGEIVLK